MPVPAIVPNPFEDDAQRESRMEANLPITSRRSLVLVGLGIASLLAFGVAAAYGLPGAGLALVPFGLVMILGGGIELLLSRL